MSPPHFQGYNQQIIMSRRINNNPALKINPGSRFIKKSSPPPPSPPLQPSPPLDGPMATSGGPRHPVVIYTHSPKIIRTHPKDFMALVQKLTGYSAPASAPPSPPSPPPPMPEPCDEYLITDIANNSDHSGGNNINKSSSDDDVISARYNWLMMGEDKDLTTMDEKVGSCSIGHDFDPKNNSKFYFDNNNSEFIKNSNNMSYFDPTSMDFGFPSTTPFDNCGDSLHLMRSSVSSPPPSLVTKGGSTDLGSPESVMDFPDFFG